MPAFDVELVKKTTLRGNSAGKGKPIQQAATGILGEPVSGNKYAIVIGIADYPGTGNDLKYTYEFDSLQNGQFTYYFVDAGMLWGKILS